MIPIPKNCVQEMFRIENIIFIIICCKLIVEDAKEEVDENDRRGYRKGRIQLQEGERNRRCIGLLTMFVVLYLK